MDSEGKRIIFGFLGALFLTVAGARQYLQFIGKRKRMG